LSYRGKTLKTGTFYCKNRFSSKSFQSIIQISTSLSRCIFYPQPNNKKTKPGWTNSRLFCKITVLKYLTEWVLSHVEMISYISEAPIRKCRINRTESLFSASYKKAFKCQ